MKNILCFLAFALALSACQKEALYSTVVQPVAGSIPVNDNHPMKDSLQAMVKKHIADGVPGMQVMVKNADGWYVVNGGYAKIEDKTPMSDRMSAWIYSISKTYLATIALRLKEKGLLTLDTLAKSYLPADITNHLPNTDRITVRQLLNHTSGLRNHTVESNYQLQVLNQPLKQLSIREKLTYIYDKPALFSPGTDFFYTNSGYALLQLILEKVSGKTYAQLLHDEIIKPLEFKKTFYNLTPQQLIDVGAPNYYFERFNNAQLENVTQWHNTIAHGLEGYGGIVANGTEVIRFMEALINGELVNAASLTEMRTWVTGKTSIEPDYGLGLVYWGQYNQQTPTLTYGHEGDGLGGSTQLLYVPANDTYVFISINAGRQVAGAYVGKVSSAASDVCRYVATWRP
ncbi:MAG TPA: serine hydrolase domain-containing protein [Saprospiraceae bacterium]|nr:serine hydrolase domain-containing protein [Saprospiraceae bacterium]